MYRTDYEEEYEGMVAHDLRRRATEMYWQLRTLREAVQDLEDQLETAYMALRDMEWYAGELQYDLLDYGIMGYDFELPA